MCPARVASIGAGVLLVGGLAASAGGTIRQDLPLRSGFAAVQGGRLYFEETGEGEVIVLIHGGVMDRRMWDDQFEALGRKFRVIRYDLPGFGNSPRREEAYTPSDELRELLRALDIQKAYIVGSSFGGGIAIDFALAYPEITKALIVAEPGVAGHRFTSEVAQTMREVFAAIGRGDREEAIEALLRGPALRHARDNPSAWKRIEALVRDNFDGFITRVAVLLREPSAWGRLSQIRAPTLLLISEHAGTDAKSIAQRILADVSTVTMVRIPDSGHLMNIEQPDAFNQAVLEFLVVLRQESCAAR